MRPQIPRIGRAKTTFRDEIQGLAVVALVFAFGAVGLFDLLLLPLSKWNFWAGAVSTFSIATAIISLRGPINPEAINCFELLSRIMNISIMFGFILSFYYVGIYWIRLRAPFPLPELAFDWTIVAYGLGPAVVFVLLLGPLIAAYGDS